MIKVLLIILAQTSGVAAAIEVDLPWNIIESSTNDLFFKDVSSSNLRT